MKNGLLRERLRRGDDATKTMTTNLRHVFCLQFVEWSMPRIMLAAHNDACMEQRDDQRLAKVSLLATYSKRQCLANETHWNDAQRVLNLSVNCLW